jgi:hypothetical protein
MENSDLSGIKTLLLSFIFCFGLQGSPPGGPSIQIL